MMTSLVSILPGNRPLRALPGARQGSLAQIDGRVTKGMAVFCAILRNFVAKADAA
ncbi:hypothetical protein LXM94_10450 [Rhizobium sp. TRM95111]|uniref:hypothetical protein n=1 Tax=Rhizobium alarense TaxID=2846851 RepID=UPI001F20FC20|nr:hypothetical protein [Rhizobium alarense]MCF3640384.1 hypothetical protein [Rhizobium alarense]